MDDIETVLPLKRLPTGELGVDLDALETVIDFREAKKNKEKQAKAEIVEICIREAQKLDW